MENIRRVTKMRRERDLKQLAKLIKRNGDVQLKLVGFYENEGCRVWCGLNSDAYYLEYKDHTVMVTDSFMKAEIYDLTIHFEVLSSFACWKPEKFKRLARFKGEKFSLVELMVEDNVDVVIFGSYFKPLNVRLWYPAGEKGGYVETPIVACREKDKAKNYVKFCRNL
jgi:hypothetical protein